jgi:hypothetical protein
MCTVPKGLLTQCGTLRDSHLYWNISKARTDEENDEKHVEVRRRACLR